jgi:hypothetical protein
MYAFLNYFFLENYINNKLIGDLIYFINSFIKEKKMKITNQTENIMELKESNIFSYIIAILLGFCAFILLFNGEFSGYSILGFLVLLGITVAIFLLTKKVHIIIDKNKKLITREEKTILKENSDKIKIEELDHIQVREIKSYSQDSEGYSHTNFSYNILLILKNKKEILLNYSSSSKRILFFRLKSNDQKTGEKIAKFLEVPYKESKHSR